jgi:hypothetical protein
LIPVVLYIYYWDQLSDDALRRSSNMLTRFISLFRRNTTPAWLRRRLGLKEGN